MEAAHIGNAGMGHKSDDRTCIPLCGEECHRLGKLSLHVLGFKFWFYWDMDPRELIKKHNARYALEDASFVPMSDEEINQIGVIAKYGTEKAARISGLEGSEVGSHVS